MPFMLNPRLDYHPKNGTAHINTLRKKEEEIIVWTWSKWKQKTEKFSKISRIDKAEPLVKSEQTEPEQCK